MTTRYFAVTLKLTQNPLHDPQRKQTGPCPLSQMGLPCNDVTGEYHTFIHAAIDQTAEGVDEMFSTIGGFNVARVEEVLLPGVPT